MPAHRKTHPGEVEQLRVALRGLDGAQGALEHNGVQQDAQRLLHLVLLQLKVRAQVEDLAIGHPARTGPCGASEGGGRQWAAAAGAGLGGKGRWPLAAVPVWHPSCDAGREEAAGQGSPGRAAWVAPRGGGGGGRTAAP